MMEQMARCSISIILFVCLSCHRYSIADSFNPYPDGNEWNTYVLELYKKEKKKYVAEFKYKCEDSSFIDPEYDVFIRGCKETPMNEFLTFFYQKFYKENKSFDSIIVVTKLDRYDLESPENPNFNSSFIVFNKGKIINDFLITKYWSGLEITSMGKKKGMEIYKSSKKWKNGCGDGVIIISKVYHKSELKISSVIINSD